MSKYLVDPKQVVPEKLYTATLKFVNAQRKKQGFPALKKLPEGHPGVEGCPIGRAFGSLHQPFDMHSLVDKVVLGKEDGGYLYNDISSPDSNDLADEFAFEEGEVANQVRVRTFNGVTKIRMMLKSNAEVLEIKAPKYVTQFLDAFDKKAGEALKKNV